MVFDTVPASFAVRERLPEVDLDSVAPRPGAGVALWLRADDDQAVHDTLAAAGVPIPAAPVDEPDLNVMSVELGHRECSRVKTGRARWG